MSAVAAEAPRPVYHDVQRQVWRHASGAPLPLSRRVAEETPVAFTYEGASYAVSVVRVFGTTG